MKSNSGEENEVEDLQENKMKYLKDDFYYY
jgi:hypothetical protein